MILETLIAQKRSEVGGNPNEVGVGTVNGDNRSEEWRWGGWGGGIENEGNYEGRSVGERDFWGLKKEDGGGDKCGRASDFEE